MRNTLLKIFLLLAIGLIPNLVFAFEVSPDDKSMQYIGMIFGPIGDLPIEGDGGGIFPKLMYLLNEIVFALAIILISFMTIIGVVNTAQEGETLGKKWSSIWIPARAGIGMYLLLPSAVSGYSWIQISVMWMIVQGVGAANSIWVQALTSLENRGSPSVDTRKVDLQRSAGAVEALFKSVLCMQSLNQLYVNDENVRTKMGNVNVSEYTTENSLYFGQFSYATQNDPPLCGGVTAPAMYDNPTTGILSMNTSGTSSATISDRYAIWTQGFRMAAGALDLPAADVLAGGYTQFGSLATAAGHLQAAAANVSETFPQTRNRKYEAAKQDGWIHAGSYYQNIIKDGTLKLFTVTVTPIAYNTSKLYEILGQDQATNLMAQWATKAETYVNMAVDSGQLAPISASKRAGDEIAVVKGDMPGRASSIFDTIFGSNFFADLATKLAKSMTTDCLSDDTASVSPTGATSAPKGQDPLACMVAFGTELASGIETAFWAALIAIGLMWLGLSSMSCIQPIPHLMDFLLSIAVPIIMLMITLLWGAGITMALYIPMIPYLVFTFAAVSWMIIVIEAIVASPLIALSLIVPSENEVGHAGHAVVILLGLILRPVLMIVGFIFATYILTVAIFMLNAGFGSTLKMTMPGGVGLFGFISVVMMYVGIATAMVHEAFSLIYALPDKVLRWMGVSGEEGADAGAQAKKMQGSVDKGIGLGKTAMTTALSEADSSRKGAGKGGK